MAPSPAAAAASQAAASLSGGLSSGGPLAASDPARALSSLATAGEHGLLGLGAAIHTVLVLAAPLVAAAALAALIAHVAQTRALWIPRRRIDHAPALDHGPGARVRATAFDLLGVAVVGAIGFGWLWLLAPRLATLVELEPRAMLAATGALGASLLAALATAWIALGVIDALARHVELAHALAMTAADKREDNRLAAADPRWARQRALLAGDRRVEGAALDAAVGGCAVIVLGDDLAVAIAWDPSRRPIPTRVAIGRRARATQLAGLARRHAVPVHRTAHLARALGDGEGPVPEAHWGELAEILAAVRRA